MKHIVAVFVFIAIVFTAALSHAGVSPQLLTAVNHIYNADFSQAGGIINSFIAANPNDPAGYLLRGMAKEWDQVTNNKRGALNSSIMADYEKANSLAEAALTAAPDNLDKKIMLGNTFMYVAKKQVDQGHKFRAGNTLKRAKEIMIEVIEKNPNAYDAYFALGVFNYFAENVPSGLKWLAALLGFKGNKAKGFEYIKKAAENPNLTQGDAAFMLVYIYEDKEHQYETARRYNDLLIAKYPNNPAFQYETGEIVHHAGKPPAEIRTSFEGFLGFCAGKPKGFCNNKYIFLSNYYIAGTFMDEKKYNEAKKHIDAAIPVNDGQYKGFNVDLDLWQGLIAKQAGKKEDAAAFFKKVEENQKNNRNAWKLAQQEMVQ